MGLHSHLLHRGNCPSWTLHATGFPSLTVLCDWTSGLIQHLSWFVGFSQRRDLTTATPTETELLVLFLPTHPYLHHGAPSSSPPKFPPSIEDLQEEGRGEKFETARDG